MDGTESVAAGEASELRLINRQLIRAVKALGDAGQTDLACRIAAEAWRILRHGYKEDAEKLNGVLHYLTLKPTKQQKET